MLPRASFAASAEGRAMSSYPPIPAVAPSPPVGVPAARAAPLLRRWFTRFVAREESDLPGRIAIGAASLAALFSLAGVVIGPGYLGVFPYYITRSLLYGASLLGGCIIAGGFLSRSRTANYCASVATTTIVCYYLGPMLGLGGVFPLAVKLGYGVALLGGAIVWALRALRRRLNSGAP
jgi:hypothetical protein